MNYYMAKSFIETQRRDFKKADGIRFIYKGYEYELRYEGGFGDFFGIYRREQGRRNFKYFDGFTGVECASANEVEEKFHTTVCNSKTK